MKKIFQSSVIVVVALSTILAFGASVKSAPKVGDAVPVFSGKDQDGKPWKLKPLLGKKIVLIYFYPKDDTPGCTKQACGLRDGMAEFADQDVAVAGVSFDSAASHRSFREKHRLNFPLLADEDGRIADLFQARREPGKNIARRVSFLVGKDGKIAHITDNPSADVHLTEIREALKRIAGK